MKRYSTALAVCLCLLWMLTSPSFAAEKTRLRFVTHYHAQESPQFEQFAQEYMLRNPDVEITYETMSWDDYEVKLPVQFAAGVGPDVMYYAARRIVGMANEGLLVNFKDTLRVDQSIRASDYFAPGFEEVTLKGQWYGFPSDAGVATLNYNVDLFNDAGLVFPKDYAPADWTWDAFLKSAKKLTRDTNGDDKLDQAGYVLSAWDGDWPTWIFANGGSILDSTLRKVTINEPKALDAMQWYADLRNSWGAAILSGQDGLGNFRAGNIGMWLDGPWQVGNYRQEMRFEWDVALPPAGTAGPRAMFFGGGYTISKSSRHPAEAWDFVKFLVSADTLRKRSKEVGRFPALRSIQREFIHTLGDLSLPPANREAYIRVYDHVVPLPLTPVWTPMRAIIGEEMGPMWQGTVPAKQAADNMAKRIQPLLATW